MDIVKLQNAVLCGELTAPPSKSAAHRALICAYLAGGGKVKNLTDSDDILATENALSALQNGDAVINCRASGSTLRFLIPLAAALGKTVTFVGEGRLPQRPIGAYLSLLPQHQVSCISDGGLPLTISGKLTGGRFELPGNISSQYVSGLLFALPLLDGDSEVVLTSPLQSKPYADMTVRMLKDYGITVAETPNGYFIKGNQTYQRRNYTVEGDWSQAAFFLAGGALTGKVGIRGLDSRSEQGDKRILDILRDFGADVRRNGDTAYVYKSKLKGISVDVRDIPDLVPVLAVLGAYAEGETVIYGGERLRLKESDRIATVVSNLKRMGISATETPDGMKIRGGCPKGASLKGYSDHRIVMAFSIAALCAKGETTMDDARSIHKSYPDFFGDYRQLGGKADVIGDRG